MAGGVQGRGGAGGAQGVGDGSKSGFVAGYGLDRSKPMTVRKIARVITEGRESCCHECELLCKL